MNGLNHDNVPRDQIDSILQRRFKRKLDTDLPIILNTVTSRDKNRKPYEIATVLVTQQLEQEFKLADSKLKTHKVMENAQAAQLQIEAMHDLQEISNEIYRDCWSQINRVKLICKRWM